MFAVLVACLALASAPSALAADAPQVGAGPETPAVVVIVEPGWVLSNTTAAADPMAAHYNPLDGLLYYGRRPASGSGGNLNRVNADGSITSLSTADRPSAVFVDPADGDVFFSEDYGGNVYRTAFGATTRSTWISGFASGDDDPVGMAVAPAGYTGPILSAGQALVVDRGANGGGDSIWRWSPSAAEGEVLVYSDSASGGTLVDPVDVAISSSAIYLVDPKDAANGAIYRLDAGPALTLIATSAAIAEPRGITIDPLTGDLWVVDNSPPRLLRVNPATGAVSEMVTGFTGLLWAGIDASQDGNQLFVTDWSGDKIYTFSRVPENQFHFTKTALPPRWQVMADPQTGIPSHGFSQRYLLSYYYGAPDVNAAPLTVAIDDNLPAGMTFEQEAHTPAMTFGQSGQMLSWQTQGQAARGQSGLVTIDARYDNPQPGDVFTNTASLHAGGYSLQAQAQAQIPIFAPLVAAPGSGELCPGDVQVRGAVQPGMTVLLKIDGAQVLQTQADAAGNFSTTYPYTGGAVETLTAQACTAGGQCSAASSPVILRPPQSFFCPQRSSWEGTPAVGPKAGQHLVFGFRNNTGEFSSLNWRIPGVYGFWNTTLHMAACDCPAVSGTTAAPSSVWVIADGVRYDPISGSHPTYTFAITGGAHTVVFWAQCGLNLISSSGRVLIDPDGYVFDVTEGFDPQEPTAHAIPGATVTLYQLTPEWGGWTPWPAHLYNNQANPQVTGSDGYFAFFTPPGQYYLQVDGKPGYQPWRSPVITVVNEIVHVNVPVTPWTEPPAVEAVTEILLTAAGPQPASVTVAAGATVQWRAEVDGLLAPAAQAALAENPALHPLSALDPISATLGWDGGMLKPGQIYQRQMTQAGRYTYSDGLGNVGELCVVTCSPLAVTLASFAAAGQTDHIVVSWETVSEVDNAGFGLYRATSADWASATLLATVPSQAPGSSQGFVYRVQDFAVQPGQEVWYWLEDVDLGGAATWHGPVSARLQTPTAVTLTTLDAQAGRPAQPALAWLTLLALLVISRLVLGRRRPATG
jgi:plastocyanin